MNGYIVDKINAAFKNLRKTGYVARQSFSCCCGCAGYEIATYLKEHPKKADKFRGSVFYTRQDRQHWEEMCGMGGRGYRRHSDEAGVWLAFGSVEVDGKELGVPTQQCGEEIVAALREQGCEVEWDGKGESRIFVKGSCRY